MPIVKKKPKEYSIKELTFVCCMKAIRIQNTVRSKTKCFTREHTHIHTHTQRNTNRPPIKECAKTKLPKPRLNHHNLTVKTIKEMEQ